jgi:hypothetical protein
VITIRLIRTLHRFGITSVNAELKPKDGTTDAEFAKAIPIRNDYIGDEGSVCRGNRVMEREALIEFVLVDRGIELNNIAPSWNVRGILIWAEKAFTAITFIIEVAVVDIVRKVGRLPSADDTRAPDFRRKIDGKARCR